MCFSGICAHSSQNFLWEPVFCFQEQQNNINVSVVFHCRSFLSLYFPWLCLVNKIKCELWEHKQCVVCPCPVSDELCEVTNQLLSWPLVIVFHSPSNTETSRDNSFAFQDLKKNRCGFYFAHFDLKEQGWTWEIIIIYFISCQLQLVMSYCNLKQSLSLSSTEYTICCGLHNSITIYNGGTGDTSITYLSMFLHICVYMILLLCAWCGGMCMYVQTTILLLKCYKSVCHFC